MRKAMLCIVVVVLMLAYPSLPGWAEDEEPVDWQKNYLELDVKYQQLLATQAELQTRFAQSQRNLLIFQDGIASFSQREVAGVKQNTARTVNQSRRALQDYLKSLEEAEADEE